MKIHILSNGKKYKWGILRSVFDFFFPYFKNGDNEFIRAEAAASFNSKTGRVYRDFYTFRSFFWHYFNSYVKNPIRDFFEVFKNPYPKLIPYIAVVVLGFSYIFKKGEYSLPILVGAIKYGSASSGSSAAGQTTFSLSFTVAAASGNLMFIGSMNADNTTDNITGVTYNSVSATRLTTVLPTSRFLAVNVLPAPSVGTNNVTVTTSSGVQIDITVWTYSGAKQSTTVGDYVLASSTGTGTTWSQAVTTAGANNWVTSISRFNSATSAGTNTVQKLAQNNYCGVYDSTLVPAADGTSITINVTGSNVAFGGTVIAFKPAASPSFYNAIRGSIGKFFGNDPSIVSYHQFEGSSIDNSGNGNNGADTSMVYSPKNGRFGQGVYFNGSSAIIKNTPTSGNFTKLFWVNFSAMPSASAYYAFWTAGVNGGTRTQFFGVFNSAGTYQIVSILTGTLASFINDATLPYSIWTPIAITYDGANVKWYKNGQLFQTIAYAGGYGTVSTEVLGGQGIPAIYSGETVNWGYAGFMDEYAHFSRVLSSQEISQYTKWANSISIIQRKGFLWAFTAITLTLTETITTTDTILRSILRTLSESITTSDTISNIKVMFKALTESITTSDSILRTVSRTLSETISTTDTIIKQLGRTLTEAITTTDTFAKIRSTTITFIEKFSIVQFLTNLLNGGTGIWTKESGATTTWTPEGGATTNWTQEPYP